MCNDPIDSLDFLPEFDQPVRYMQRTRDWYQALGFDRPYRWAHYAEVPFQPLRVPLAEARITLVTTAAPFQPDKGPQGPGAPWNAAAKFFEVYSGRTGAEFEQEQDLRIAHVGVDRQHASLGDVHCWFPLVALRQAEAEGRIGPLAARFHGLPTDRSQRNTIERFAPEILNRCRQDGVDAAILVANCPVCHQSISLVARHLERNGIATVVIGAARDIVEYCGVPRFLFSDFPLGNAAARPDDPDSRRSTVGMALDLLAHATAARTTIQSPLKWHSDPSWKLDYLNPDALSESERARLRAEYDTAKASVRSR